MNVDVVRPGEAGLVDDRMTEELLEPVSEIGDRRRGQDDRTNRMKAIAPLEAREWQGFRCREVHRAESRVSCRSAIDFLLLTASRAWAVRCRQDEDVDRLRLVCHFDIEVRVDAFLDEAIQRGPAVWGGQIETRIVSLAGIEFDRHLHASNVSAVGPGDELL